MKKTNTRECMTNLQSELTANELTLLKEKILESDHKGRILEIGTAAGGTFVEMFNTLKESQPEIAPNKFVVIDTFEYFTDHLGIWKSNLEKNSINPDEIDIRKGDSYKIFKQTQNEKSDYSFILVDASHLLKNMIRDIRWLERLKVGGIAAFHDYSTNFPGVQIAVNVLLKNNSNYKKVNLVESLLVIEKTAETTSREISCCQIFLYTVLSKLLDLKRSAKKRLKKIGL